MVTTGSVLGALWWEAGTRKTGDRRDLARDMAQNKIKVGEGLHPAGLATRNFMWFTEIGEVIVIGENGGRVRGAQESTEKAFANIYCMISISISKRR